MGAVCGRSVIVEGRLGARVLAASGREPRVAPVVVGREALDKRVPAFEHCKDFDACQK